MAGVKEFYCGVRRSLIAAVVLLFADLAFTGSFLFSISCCPIWILVSLLKNAIQRPGWRLALVRIGIPALTLWLVWVNNDFQLAIANDNAQKVMMACEKYHADNGKFPENLDKLVPQYMHSVPVARYCLGPSSKIDYYYNSNKPMLVWQVLPPYYRRIYDFETRRWSYLD